MKLLDQTVTLYRLENGCVQRRVLEGCAYFWHDEEAADALGIRRTRKCLLIVPGAAQTRPGDRVLAGTGPEITAEQWPEFLPASTPALSQLAWVKPMHLHGRLHHTEAGC